MSSARQIVSGRHRLEMYVSHHLTGAAVESASQLKGSSLFMKGVVKVMEPYGVHSSKHG